MFSDPFAQTTMPRKDWQGYQETEVKYPGKAQKEREQTIIRKATYISCKYGNDFAITGVIENNEGYIYYPNKQYFQNFFCENTRKYSNVLNHTHHLKTKNEILLFKRKFKGLENKILEYASLLNKKIYFIVHERNSGDFFYFGDPLPNEQNENKKNQDKSTSLLLTRRNQDNYDNNNNNTWNNNNNTSKNKKYKFAITKKNLLNLFQNIFNKIENKKKKEIINFCLKNYPSFFEQINDETL